MKNIIKFNNYLFENNKIFKRLDNIYNIEEELSNKSISEILKHLNSNFDGKNIELNPSSHNMTTAIVLNVIKFSLSHYDNIIVYAENIYFLKNGKVLMNKKTSRVYVYDIITELENVEHVEDEIKNKDIDPYGEENWGEDLDYIKINESTKKKVFKIKRFEIDPYGEEDWGWDYNDNIDDSKFVNRHLIYKRKNYNSYEYKSLILKSHNETILGRNLNDMVNNNRIFPLTKREIDRIKKNKILFSTYDSKYNLFGGLQRISYLNIKDEPYFLDQEYIDKYLNVEYVKENIKYDY